MVIEREREIRASSCSSTYVDLAGKQAESAVTFTKIH